MHRGVGGAAQKARPTVGGACSRAAGLVKPHFPCLAIIQKLVNRVQLLGRLLEDALNDALQLDRGSTPWRQ